MLVLPLVVLELVNRRGFNQGFPVKVVLLGLVAWYWIGLVIDQMPCFLGAPNCD